MITILVYILYIGISAYIGIALVALYGLLATGRRGNDHFPSFSVIIAARNEENTIGGILKDLSVQDYPHEKLEIVVVDDCSTDRTIDKVLKMKEKNPAIKLLDSQVYESPYSNKKKAISIGISQSSGEIIMTVDADCRVKRSWIKCMAAQFNEGVEVVAANLRIEGKGLLHILETLEYNGLQTASSGLMNAGFPVTCNGANLAYRRSAFERVGGFGGISKTNSGDDDMLMQKIGKDKPGSVVWYMGEETTVSVDSNIYLSNFISQRSRWISKIAFYPSLSAKLSLGCVFAFFLVFPVLFFSALAGKVSFMPLLWVYTAKSLADLSLAGIGSIKEGRAYYLFMFPLAEFIHVPYILLIAWKGLTGNFVWKGRSKIFVEAAGENEL